MDPLPSKRRANGERRGWYTLSVDTLRGLMIVGSLLLAAVIGWSVWDDWHRREQQREAAEIIADSQAQIDRLAKTPGASRYEAELETGRQQLQAASRAYAQESFADAHRAAVRARDILSGVVDSLARRGGPGTASFISVHGDVEFRRGERGDWEPARSRSTLAEGDYVRTGGDGSAEVMFDDGTLYTVRPNTSFVVSRPRADGSDGGERTISMDYGWVNLNTRTRGARVSTPATEARVREDSEAFVAYERSGAQGRIGALRGAVEVGGDGDPVRLGPLQEVVQTAGRIGVPRPLPPAPSPNEPAEDFRADRDRSGELTLSWDPVDGAARYALQISRSASFVDNVIDVADRAAPRARLGLRGDGTFLWRVAAISREGGQGPWSPARRFQVAATIATGGDGGDTTPPALRIDEVTAYGNIFLVSGRTEPGAAVEINGESVKVDAVGSFVKTIQLNKEGWSILEVRARDAWGNVATRRPRVHVENP